MFIREERLSIDYLPKRLPHREHQLEQLLSPNESIAILVGPVGVGKTSTLKKVGEIRSRSGVDRLVHVSGYRYRTSYLMMRALLRRLGLSIPRGYSTDEYLEFLAGYLSSREGEIIVALDDVDYLRDHEKVVEMVTRLSEYTTVYCVYHSKYLLPRALRGYQLVSFTPYTVEEIEDILMARVFEEEAVDPRAIDDDIIELIALMVGYDVGGRGDCRLALEILWRAGKYSIVEGKEHIGIEEVRRAYMDTLIDLNEMMFDLDLEELNLLKDLLEAVPPGEKSVDLSEIGESGALRSLSDRGIVRVFRGHIVPLIPIEVLLSAVDERLKSYELFS